MKIKKYEVITAIILLTSMIVAGYVYYSAYSVADDFNDIEAAVKEYVGSDSQKNIQVLETAKTNNSMYALYTTSERGFKGIVAFERGLNLRWKPVGARSVLTGDPIARTSSLDDVVIYGVNVDQRAVSYEYYDETTNEILYANSITEPDFIDIFEPAESQDMRGRTELRILDDQGNDIRKELYVDYGSVGSSSTFPEFRHAEDALAAAVLMIGLALSIFFWKYCKDEEEFNLSFEKTKLEKIKNETELKN
ncbi:hypothetical protein MmiAt1_07220 [Methanimicrococcus sp. At1]|uniref:Uncharacterized protein n=1 Tax=Methanimicrococcus hacksteinii TaxID=3028293 RepID=A0ABU3VQJ3_9EURY|nr:hypothetical protein [Methanimicrococcus sp. At1]MDV0445165.1 hypothetical protein [Methanimicrococcus sp. At1]